MLVYQLAKAVRAERRAATSTPGKDRATGSAVAVVASTSVATALNSKCSTSRTMDPRARDHIR